MSRWWVKSHQTADFGDNRDTKRQKYVTVVSWQHKHTFYLILLREDSSDSGGLRSLRSLRPLPTYRAWSSDHLSTSGPSPCPCEDLFQWSRLVNGRGPRRSRGRDEVGTCSDEPIQTYPTATVIIYKEKRR